MTIVFIHMPNEYAKPHADIFMILFEMHRECILLYHRNGDGDHFGYFYVMSDFGGGGWVIGNNIECNGGIFTANKRQKYNCQREICAFYEMSKKNANKLKNQIECDKLIYS